MRRAFAYLTFALAALASAPASAGIADNPDWLLARAPAAPQARDAHAMAYDSRRERVVLFAGANEYGVLDFADTWEWDGTSWTRRTTTTSPPSRYGFGMAFDAARGRVVLFGGFDFLTGSVRADTWEWDGTTWLETTPATSPPGRTGHGMIYDTARQRIVLFGGADESGTFADTWEWDGSAWLERTPASSPPPRVYASMVHDAARGRTVVFGGFDGTTYLADTWEWDGNDWVQRVTAVSPPGRTWQMAAFDDTRGRMVLFGGYNGIKAFADTWEWDGSSWLETTPAAGPTARVVGSMVFYRPRSRALLFGGYDGSNALADTWEWDGSAWIERTPKKSPPPRSNHAAAYDDARGKTVIFGGYWGGPFLADTWEWDGTSWAEKSPALSPPSRIFPAMAYDQARARVVLFGGFGRTGPVGDTWEWDGTSWVERHPTTSPPARHSHTMAYDAARGRVVLYGGSNSVDLFGDTWEWDGNDWVEVTPAASPAPRYRHAMVYDSARERVLLFGGCGDGACPSSDTWEWDGSSWVEKTPTTSPPARLEHAMAYDAARERTVVFSGTDLFQLIADTWEWDGNDWTEVPTTLSPPPRFHHTMTYDGVSGGVLVFGGYDGTYLADSWEFGPITVCGNATSVVAYVPGAVSASPTALPALGAPDFATVDLGIGGQVELGFDRGIQNGPGTDLIVHATASAVFRVEAADGGSYIAIRECLGGSCQLDLSETGLSRASSLRITALSSDIGAEIDAVSAIHTAPLTITCPASVTVECQAAGQAVVSLPPATASASCFGTASIANDVNDGGADASGSYPLGTTTVTFLATDGSGTVASCQTSITISDTTPPVVTVQASPAVLWPPNHAMRPVRFTVAAVDACDPSPVVLLQSVASSEPDDAPGRSDGATTGDVQGAAIGSSDFDVALRAERDGRGPGRSYSVRYRSTDASGNSGTGVGTVRVPHDRRPSRR